jgi:hypothetical protein
MSLAPLNAELYCPECGATRRWGEQVCWLCGHPMPARGAGGGDSAGLSQAPILLATAVPDRRPFAPSQAGYAERVRFQYGINSMLLLMTLTAVLMGTFSIAPGLGIVAAVLVVPALVPTCMAAMRRGSRGQPMTTIEKTATLILWVALMMVVMVAAGAAFFIACLAGLTLGDPMVALTVLGPIGGLVVAVFVYVLLVRRVRF